MLTYANCISAPFSTTYLQVYNMIILYNGIKASKYMECNSSNYFKHITYTIEHTLITKAYHIKHDILIVIYEIPYKLVLKYGYYNSWTQQCNTCLPLLLQFFRSDTPTCLLNIYFPHPFTNVTTINYNILMA